MESVRTAASSKFYLDGFDHMRKYALTLTCTACVFGAFGVFCRWIQGMTAFEENGLYKPGNVGGIILILLYIAAFAALVGFVLFFKKRQKLASPPEFGLAIAGDRRWALIVALATTLIMAAGCVMLLVTAGEEQLASLLRLLALLGVLCAAGFMGLAGSINKSSPRGSALEVGLCLASALPVAFCCFWLVVSYRQDAATSVVWNYAPEIIALASSLLAFYYVAGHAYGRPRPFAAIFFCEFGSFSCFVTLPDGRLLALQIMFFAVAVMQLYFGLLLTANLRPMEEIGERFPGALEAEGLVEPEEPGEDAADEPELEDMGGDTGGEEDFVEVTEQYLGEEDGKSAENGPEQKN